MHEAAVAHIPEVDTGPPSIYGTIPESRDWRICTIETYGKPGGPCWNLAQSDDEAYAQGPTRKLMLLVRLLLATSVKQVFLNALIR
jgi:hypothetical protein